MCNSAAWVWWPGTKRHLVHMASSHMRTMDWDQQQQRRRRRGQLRHLQQSGCTRVLVLVLNVLPLVQLLVVMVLVVVVLVLKCPT